MGVALEVPIAMSETESCVIDVESLEDLFEPTVEIPAALVLAACGCCCIQAGPVQASGAGGCC